MMHLTSRNLQAINLFISSCSLVFLALGILVDDWVRLNIETGKNVKIHSPWKYSTIWPKGDMEVVRILLLVVLSLSYFYNCYLGMEYTYMFPQTACVIFTAAFLTCFTGILLISALILYHIRLRQGKSVYYLNYHLTWNISTAYISIFFHFASGFFSLLEYQRRATDSSLPSETETASQGSDFRMQSGSSIQVISLPETPPPPPSIVRVRSQESRNSDIPKPTQIQKRRVTWAL
ncbi:transmembrane protein 225 [Pipistrellus kuhlii]|uniref:Transmembrane protein 225 n=1 Tax=Pipistrellus kuhlii TaxID=59472 RepID=A0A7J7UHQ8_PIPKU|nr:transmembrane protein 225 [Pipistrellus kuhlii]KAF6312324.1 transmembrane protein 225 [Pipistrellus kuhlii]